LIARTGKSKSLCSKVSTSTLGRIVPSYIWRTSAVCCARTAVAQQSATVRTLVVFWNPNVMFTLALLCIFLFLLEIGFQSTCRDAARTLLVENFLFAGGLCRRLRQAGCSQRYATKQTSKKPCKTAGILAGELHRSSRHVGEEPACAPRRQSMSSTAHFLFIQTGHVTVRSSTRVLNGYDLGWVSLKPT
jgi:hypothetical protein